MLFQQIHNNGGGWGRGAFRQREGKEERERKGEIRSTGFSTMFDGFKALRRVRQLEEDFRELKRRIELMEVAWTDTLDRFKAIMGRIEKRAARAESGSSAPSAETPTTLSPGGSDGGSALTANQQLINQKILARRNRLALLSKGGDE